MSSRPFDARLLTFLIADVRGYTRFTHERGDEAAARLADRFASLCEAVLEAHEGQVIELRGDEALAVFSSARQALRGAVALQDAFAQAMNEDPSLPLIVGIGLDAGEPIPVRGGYRGGALNLAARLCSIAEGGEILASDTVLRLARKTEGIAFVDRGQVTLKGLADPVRVLQIGPEGVIPEALPPLQPVLVAHPTNLPDDPTPFIGREGEISQIAALFRDPHIRLVTLTGTGGTGKTRLAVQVGNTLLYDFRDGVFFCDLAPLADSGLVPSVIASVLGIKEDAGRELTETLIEQLKDKHLLLLLDNFEHLLDACQTVARLLDACRDLHVLVTSRTVLRLRREHEYLVPPLAVPAPQHLPADISQLLQYEAVALFIERAAAVKPGFRVTDENASAIAEICARLDGLPLALELAAARIKLFPPPALLQRLSSRLKVLTGGARDAPERQQTLRGTIDWSYSLLTEEERMLFARLSVFGSGCTLEAAESVCNLNGALDVLEGVTSLVDKSLLRREGEDEPRLVMLETIREYATEKLSGRGEIAETSRRHAEYFMVLADEGSEGIYGLDGVQWFARLESERHNFQRAMSWARRNCEAEIALRIARKLLWFWHSVASFREGRAALEAALQTPGVVDPHWRAHGSYGAGVLAAAMGDFDAATQLLEQSVDLFSKMGDTVNRWKSRMWLGNTALLQGEHARAATILEEAVADCRNYGDHGAPGDLDRVLLNFGLALFLSGHVDRARETYDEALARARDHGSPIDMSAALDGVGHTKLALGDVDGAEAAWREALTLARDANLMYPMPYLFEGLAGVAANRENGVRAARLLAAASVLRAETGAHLLPGERGPVDRFTAEAQALLPAEEWEMAWQEGQTMSVAEAISYALQERH